MIKVKNISEEEISVRVRLSGEDLGVSLKPGETSLSEIMSTDMRILQKRTIISCEEIEQWDAKEWQEVAGPFVGDMGKTDISTTTTNEDINHDEPMDSFHTTEDVNTVLVDTGEKIGIGTSPPPYDFKIVDNPLTLNNVKQEVAEYSEESGGLKTGRWTEDEIKMLKKVYPKKGGKTAAEELKRSYKSVQKKVANLNLKRKFK